MLLLTVLLLPAGSASASLVKGNFYNVIMQESADPWVYRHTDGYYYFTKTTGNNVTIWKSETLTGIDAAPSRVISTGCCNIWAPEIYYINGAWYIYYAKDDGNNANHRMYVLQNTAADPMQGTWVNKGQITDSTNKWAIDGTVLQVGSQLYFIWSGWEGDTNVRQNLYIASMSDPWTISSNRTEIARPTYSWETTTRLVGEAACCRLMCRMSQATMPQKGPGETRTFCICALLIQSLNVIKHPYATLGPAITGRHILIGEGRNPACRIPETQILHRHSRNRKIIDADNLGQTADSLRKIHAELDLYRTLPCRIGGKGQSLTKIR
ncbi:glycoside hydrolase family 43 protein [Cohnella sp. NL03-T5]|nr:glycoside hydrolase family 43 protein [Cohnella silvisoli]